MSRLQKFQKLQAHFKDLEVNVEGPNTDVNDSTTLHPSFLLQHRQVAGEVSNHGRIWGPLLGGVEILAGGVRQAAGRVSVSLTKN